MSINDRVILPFCEGFFSRNFAYAKFQENSPHENFRIYSTSSSLFAIVRSIFLIFNFLHIYCDSLTFSVLRAKNLVGKLKGKGCK